MIRGALEMNIFPQNATPRARRRPILVSNEKFFKKIPSLGTNIFPQVLKDEFLEYILFQEFGYLRFLPCSRVVIFTSLGSFMIFPISPTHRCPWFYAFEEVPSLRSWWKGKPLPSTEAARLSDTSMVFFHWRP